MQEKQTATIFQNASAYVNLKTQLAQFTEMQVQAFHSLMYRTNQLLTKQHAKSNFLPENYAAEISTLMAELEIYFTNLIVKITSFPLLGPLATILEKIMSQYTRIIGSVQEYWLSQHRTKRKTATKSKGEGPPMELCLHCAQNIRQEEIKQTKFQVFNPIENPYLFFSNYSIPNKVETFEETRQKQLQDRLNQLANNMQLGQNCMRQMIEQLANDKAYTSDNISSGKEDKGIMPQLMMPLIRSVFRHVKKQKKISYDFGAQVDQVDSMEKQKVKQNGTVGLQQSVIQTTERSIKRDTQYEERGQIRGLQGKIAESQHENNFLQNQVNVLKGINQNLQKKNQQLQLQLTILKDKKLKQAKKYENAKSSIPKIDQKPQHLQQLKPQIEIERITMDRKRKSYRGDILIKKGDPSAPVNLSNTSSLMAGQNKGSNSLNHSRNGSKVFRNTDTIFFHQKDSNSSKSIKAFNEDYIEEDSDFEVVVNHNMSPSINTIYEQSHSHIATQDQPLEDTTNNLKRNSTNKVKVNINKNKISKDSSQFQQPTKFNTFSSINRRDRRLATIYSRDELLKIIYDQETKGLDNPIDFLKFKQLCESLFRQTISTSKRQRQAQQSLKNKIMLQKPKKNKNYLHKKSASTLKNNLRSNISTLLQPPMLEDFSRYPRTTHNSMNFEQINISEQRKTPSNMERTSCLNLEDMELPQLRNKLFISQKFEKQVVLQRNQHQKLTQLMAYLAQLKIKSNNNYEAVRRLIAIQDPLKQNNQKNHEKQLLQKNIGQLIRMHKKCQHQTNEVYCTHLQELKKVIIKMLK